MTSEATEEMIEEVSYAHKSAPNGQRFIDLKGRKIPVWAVDVKPFERAFDPDLRATPTDAVERLRSALERLQSNFDLLLAGKPIRGVAETRAETKAALESTSSHPYAHYNGDPEDTTETHRAAPTDAVEAIARAMLIVDLEARFGKGNAARMAWDYCNKDEWRAKALAAMSVQSDKGEG